MSLTCSRTCPQQGTELRYKFIQVWTQDQTSFERGELMVQSLTVLKILGHYEIIIFLLQSILIICLSRGDDLELVLEDLRPPFLLGK